MEGSSRETLVAGSGWTARSCGGMWTGKFEPLVKEEKERTSMSSAYDLMEMMDTSMYDSVLCSCLSFDEIWLSV